jgi:hypothetical protein
MSDAATATFKLASDGEGEEAAGRESGDADGALGLALCDEVGVVGGHLFEGVPFIGVAREDAGLDGIDGKAGREMAGESVIVVGASAGRVDEEERVERAVRPEGEELA